MSKQSIAPFFYILIPAYNVQEYVVKCLESIEAQTYRNFECHIINDGSDDQTLERIQQFLKLKKNFFVYDYPNRGVSSTRNSLLEKVGDGYVVWVDPDDYVAAEYLEACAILISNYDPDILFFDFYYNDGKNKSHVLPFNEGYVNFEEILQELAFDWQFPSQLWNKVYRSGIFKDVHFAKDLTILEDFDIQLSLFRKGKKFYYSPQSFYHYIQHSQSALSQKNKDKEIEQLRVRRKRMEELFEINPSLLNKCLLSWLISYYYSLSLASSISKTRSEKSLFFQLLEEELNEIVRFSAPCRLSGLNKMLLWGGKKMPTILLLLLPRFRKFSRLIKQAIIKYK